MPNHSPTPWYKDTKHELSGSTIIRDATGFHIASSQHWLQETHEANEKLIIAAPQMLQALMKANKYLAGAAETGALPGKNDREAADKWCEVQQAISNAIHEATK